MKKKVIIPVIAVGVFVIGIIIVSNTNLLNLSNIWFDGQKEDAIRGDLVIPVTATGTIVASELIQIKSKAGGVVEDIPVSEGQMVEEGDTLVVLDPVDEKRNVEARQADLDRVQSAWEKSMIVMEKQHVDLPLQTQLAQARLQDAEARLEEAEFRFNRVKNIGLSAKSPQEFITAKMTYKTALAAKNIAEINLAQSKSDEVILLKSAAEDVAQAAATMQSATKALEDAKQRFKETVVVARSSGMVYSIQVRRGETIQSGMSSFAGGTPLMILADVRSMFVIAQIDEADIGAIRDIAPIYARPGHTGKLDESEYKQKAEQIIKAAENEEQAEELANQLIGRPVDVTVEAYLSMTYKGVIERILPEPVQQNNAIAFGVRIRLMGEDVQKLMGLQADLSFRTKIKKNVILVKNEALASEGRNCFVYIPDRETSRQRWGEKKVPVKIGETDGTFTEIISGINDGDQVWIKRPHLTEKEREARESA